ncbi:MAG: hypothetical protein OZ919_01930 [Xanthomonadaceae bacterium]|nr:hypothetical protein [Xanthomonadaceae bacterium]
MSVIDPASHPIADAPTGGEVIRLVIDPTIEALEARSADERAWVVWVLTHFPAPQVRHVPDIISALERIVDSIPWASELLPDDFLGPLSRVATKAKALRTSAPDIWGSRNTSLWPEHFRGDFLPARTLMDEHPVPAAEALRLVLLACLWAWADSDDPHRTLTASLHAAIRGLHETSIDKGVLFRLGSAKTLSAFVARSADLPPSAPDVLATGWSRHIQPLLEAAAALKKPARPSPREEPSVDDGEDDQIERFGKRARRRVILPPQMPAPLVAEPLDEVTPVLTTAYLPAPSGNPDAALLSAYRLRQAIWSRNTLLCPNHPDAMLWDDFALSIRTILAELDREDCDESLCSGLLVLLLMGLTGRTAGRLATTRLVTDATATPDRANVELLLDEGAFRMPCYWMWDAQGQSTSHFRPSEQQRSLLEQHASHFILPIHPRAMNLLRRHSKSLAAILTASPETREQAARSAAQHVSLQQQVEVSPGRLRASFAVHLYEASRDIAATQLICSDTLGFSEAPLAYYAPKRKSLARTYWDLQCRLLASQDKLPPVPEEELRTGSMLTATPATVAAMTRDCSRHSTRPLDRINPDHRLVSAHRRVLYQSIAMLVGAATHRPVEALFDLRIGDFFLDRDGGAALFRDKVHDAAHDPRLVALPPTVCRQLDAYLAHLAFLAESNGEHAQRGRDALKGRAPLFFDLADNDAIAELDLRRWKEGMPDSWSLLPPNWGRHWIATRSRDAGVRAEIICLQMGHLESVGYPFSAMSPTEPWAFVEEAARALEPVVKQQGWRVARGMGVGAFNPVSWLNPLRLWDEELANHSRQAEARDRRWREAIKAQQRMYRDRALADVLDHPALVASGVSDIYRRKAAMTTKHTLTRADFERIRDELQESTGECAALGLARANAVYRVARTVNRLTGQRSETPGPAFSARRALDNAFFPRMLEAVRQVEALRNHLQTGVLPREHLSWDDATSAVACAVMALALFAWCESVEVIRGAIERRSRIIRLGTLEDVVLVPWGDAPHQNIACRGVAAVVLARLNRKLGDGVEIDWPEVEQRLGNLLPPWATGRTGARSVMARLCGTVAVSNRYELSPAARKSNQVVAGATPAHILEQRALLDGDPVEAIDRSWESIEDTPSTDSSYKAPAGRRSNARTQYLELCRAFPGSGKDSKLPATGACIAAGEAASPEARDKLRQEIHARITQTAPDKCLQPIVHLLSHWVLDMLVHGTAQLANPALSTVETYLTRIGGILVQWFGQSALEDIGEEELEAAYLAVIEAKEESRPAAASTILSFHAHCVRHFGLPELDLSSVRLWLRDTPEALADARLVLPSERTRMLEILAKNSAEPRRDQTPRDIRNTRLASMALTLIAYGGLRRSEALGLQFRDVGAQGAAFRAHIRPNHSRRLKTIGSRRTIRLDRSLFDAAGADPATWVGDERTRLAKRRLERSYVFSAADAPSDPSERVVIGQQCVQASLAATGGHRSRLHALRHLRAMEQTTGVFLSNGDRQKVQPTLSPDPVHTLRGDLALPRDLHSQALTLGHSGPDTTLRSYCHVPWLMRSRSDSRLLRRFGERTVVANLTGLSLHALNWCNKQHPDRSGHLAWLDVALRPRALPKPKPPISQARQVDRPTDLSWPFESVRELWVFLGEARRMGSLERAIRMRGFEHLEPAQFCLAVGRMERRLGFQLLPTAGASGRYRPRRIARFPRAALKLEALLDRFDQDVDGDRETIARLATSAMEYMSPADDGYLLLPCAEAAELTGLLGALEPGITTVEESDQDSELVAVRVHPAMAVHDGARAMGWAATLKALFAVISLASTCKRDTG